MKNKKSDTPRLDLTSLGKATYYGKFGTALCMLS